MNIAMQKIIDSHVHFWNPAELSYTWLAGAPLLNRSYLPADLPGTGTDWSLEKVVFVQADCAADQGVEEAQWVASLAEADPRIAGIVAFAPLEDGGETVQPVLDLLSAIPLVKGVRRLLQDEPAGFSTQAAFVEGVRLLASYNFSFDICIRHWQLPEVIELVRACPNLRFVLDHFGKPDIKNGQIDPWREGIAQLAQFPNVMCKLSGIVTEADHQSWQPADLAPYIDQVLTSFGADRVMFGGDYPVVLLASEYPRWIETALQATASLSDVEKQKIFFANAASFYGLK
ncbi:MAG: amidohydrolase family protein [Anaerolineae bacterium]|nr:amidohydrolase family protein [Anaerolineae bacterium]